MGTARPAHPFLAALGRGAIALDGAMGTALFARGAVPGTCLEELVVSRPAWIGAIHREHVAAGARAIETDTFGANRIRLGRHGLEDRVGELNASAVAIAREAAGSQAWVLGAMGPACEGSPETRGRAFEEQAAALVEAGVDAIVLETFFEKAELEIALAAVGRAARARVPVVALVTVDARLAMSDGTHLGDAALVLARGADVIGINCCDGPATALEALTVLRRSGALLAAVPSAGLAHDASPADFASFARRARELGARLVGGCCGTTPAHIAAIAAALADGDAS